MKTPQNNSVINGVATSNLITLGNMVKQDFSQGKLQLQATTTWVDGPRSVTRIQSFQLGKETHRRGFNLTIDEPEALGGSNLGPNPQEVLLAGLNSCILTTFVYLASLQGIPLDQVEVSSQGQLELASFFHVNKALPPGYQALQWSIKVKSSAPVSQLQGVYQVTLATSPNLWNLLNPVNIQQSQTGHEQ